MSWIMSTKREERPVRYRFFIGQVQVAEVSFAGKTVLLRTMGERYSDEESSHTSMSEAMKEMHRLLNAPSPEGAKVGGMKQ